ncbi:MAG TPA: histidine kinase dimerization/phospho-acceptor domain-containing protein [Vicinamibacterales bacterium]|nr:histidine kinase dimerization/phospho-acceptor domain-containing protein [Vicinamibacterales bacterium]
MSADETQLPDEMSRVLSLLSHEMRGPLGVIRGYLRFIEQSDEPLSERTENAIAAALRASARLADLLDEASLVAHLRLGDVPIDRARMALAALVESGVTRASLPKETVAFDAASLPDVCVEVDHERMSAAVATLIEVTARSQSDRAVVRIEGEQLVIGDEPTVRLRIIAPVAHDLAISEMELNVVRGGFGLAVLLAAMVVTAHWGSVRELYAGDRRIGVLLALPIM